MIILYIITCFVIFFLIIISVAPLLQKWSDKLDKNIEELDKTLYQSRRKTMYLQIIGLFKFINIAFPGFGLNLINENYKIAVMKSRLNSDNWDHWEDYNKKIEDKKRHYFEVEIDIGQNNELKLKDFFEEVFKIYEMVKEKYKWIPRDLTVLVHDEIYNNIWFEQENDKIIFRCFLME